MSETRSLTVRLIAHCISMSMDVVVVWIIELPAVSPIVGMCLAPLVEPLLVLPEIPSAR